MFKNCMRNLVCHVLLALFLTALPGLAQVAAPVATLPDEANIVKNGSFENGMQSWNIPQTASVSLSEAGVHGKSSLKLTNASPSSYTPITQKFSVPAGQIVRYSAWIKGENLRSANAKDKGASLYVEAYGNGKYIFGSYGKNLSGTFDWTYVEGLWYLPDHATDFVIGLYLRKGTTGTVWFDDVKVQIEQTAFQASLVSPNYRHTMLQGDTTPWKLHLEYNLAKNQQNPYVKSQIVDSRKFVVHEEAATLDAPFKELIFDHQGKLPVGTYDWNIEMQAETGKVAHRFNYPVTVVSKMPAVYLDKDGILVDGDKKFFPLGIYLGGAWSATNDHLARIADAGFNTVLSYAYGDDWKSSANNANATQFLDNAQQQRLRVVYSLKDMYDGHARYPRNGKTGELTAREYIEQLKGHPALLSWYINDEFGPDWIPQIHKRYDLVKELDPEHPVYQVLFQYGLIQKYFSTTDIWGTDPYPIDGRNYRKLNLVTEMTQKTQAAGRGSKGVWQVLQIFDNGTYDAAAGMRPPTLAEMRNMSYQALVNGARGIIYYSYFDLWFTDHERERKGVSEAAFNKRWPDVQALIAEIKPLTEVILQNNSVSLERMAPSPVQYRAWQDGNRLHLAVVSTEDAATTLRLNLPRGWKLSARPVPGITWQHAGNELTLNLTGQASGVVVLEKDER